MDEFIKTLTQNVPRNLKFKVSISVLMCFNSICVNFTINRVLGNFITLCLISRCM